jgi:hypothetical protein
MGVHVQAIKLLEGLRPFGTEIGQALDAKPLLGQGLFDTVEAYGICELDVEARKLFTVAIVRAEAVLLGEPLPSIGRLRDLAEKSFGAKISRFAMKGFE